MDKTWIFLMVYWILHFGRSDSSNDLVQLHGCTCVGYIQSYQCTVSGGGSTTWQGSVFDCTQSHSMIDLRHSKYATKAVGECNGGLIKASSVSVSGSLYTSMLNITVREEMNNKTVECVHHNIQGNVITIGQALLRITNSEEQCGPLDGVHVRRFERKQLVFGWNEVTATSYCPYIQYIITAINCGICPNSTVNTSVTCTLTDTSTPANDTCMFAVQMEVCGYILGERSEYITVNLTVNVHDVTNLAGDGSGEQSTESDLTICTGATLITTTFLIIVTTATISCTNVNVKVLKDNKHLKNQLKSIPRQRSSKVEEELTTKYYEEVDMCQVSTNTDIHINCNPAYSAVKDL